VVAAWDGEVQRRPVDLLLTDADKKEIRKIIESLSRAN
jgi:hypothetical protein